jgi:hypothetical protein
MASFFEQKDRNVVPNFRSFLETVELGELSDTSCKIRNGMKGTLGSDLLEWENTPSIGAASDLLSSALVAGITNNDAVSRAAEFVLNNKRLATPSQLDLAERILKKNHSGPTAIVLPKISEFLEENSRTGLQKKIQQLKKANLRFQTDPTIYTELARLYSILGQEEKAKKNMIIAVGLASENRYVLRSFIRLFAHYDDIDFAYDFLKKRISSKRDPWLVSAEIALATILGKDSKAIKTGKTIVNSGAFSDFSLAELRTALGTVELRDGSRRKSRDLFRAAIIDPNDNALAQTEWALNVDRMFDLDVSQFDVKRNYEALALEAFNNSRWEETLEHSENWFMDMPFSKRPLMLASHVSSVVLDNQDVAQSFCKAGLLTHPGDPQITNNLAYSLALDGKVNDALTLIDNLDISKVDEQGTEICLSATRGLINFRKGNYDLGRAFYLEAIDAASRIQNTSYYQLALLNYAREELLCNGPLVEIVKEKVRRLKIDPKALTLKIFFDRVVSLFEQKPQ